MIIVCGAMEQRAIKPDGFIAKGRLDALTDGIFAFAMTLLVINVDLPEGFYPKSSADFLAGLARLQDAFIAYIITFVVLAAFWLGQARVKKEPEAASAAYAWAVLSQLFFVTCLPFSMRVVGRYDFAPAVWLYGGNMILLALTSLRISFVIERDTRRRLVESGRIDLAVLIASAILSMAISFIAGESAMLAYFLNFASPLLHRWRRRE